MNVIAIKIRTRVYYSGRTRTQVSFGPDTDNEPLHTGAFVQIGIEKWKDMGSPSEITATFEPGDKLNLKKTDE